VRKIKLEILFIMSITLAQAEKAIAKAQEKSVALDTKMNIAIVDAGANLVAFARMDGAWLGSLDISIKKAKTARFFDMNTGVIGELSQPGGALFNIEHSNNGLITFPGGIPIKNVEGVVIGAIGVSGSSVENDHAVAVAGVSALLKVERTSQKLWELHDSNSFLHSKWLLNSYKTLTPPFSKIMRSSICSIWIFPTISKPSISKVILSLASEMSAEISENSNCLLSIFSLI
jgi:uncharacterized protein GlcG (DUF336 family)